MVKIKFNSAKTYEQDMRLKAGTQYSASQWMLVLTNASTYTAASTMLDVIVQQCPCVGTSGYADQPLTWSTSTFDAIQNRAESSATATFSPTGTSVPFDRFVVMADRPYSEALGIRKLGNRLVDSINATTNRLHFALADAIDLPANTLVTVTADAGGTVPPELLSAGNPQLLYVVNPVDTGSERSIQLSLTSGGAAIDFSAGTLPIRVRYAGGRLVEYDDPGATTINDGASYSVTVNDNYSDGSANVNV